MKGEVCAQDLNNNIVAFIRHTVEKKKSVYWSFNSRTLAYSGLKIIIV